MHRLLPTTSSPFPSNMVSPGVLPPSSSSPAVSKWRPPLSGFCWLVVPGAAERTPACLALEPGFDEGLGRAVHGIGGGQTRQVKAAGRSEPLDGGASVLGPQGEPGSDSEPVSAGMCSRGFGCNCLSRSWQKCPARERSYFSMGLELPVLWQSVRFSPMHCTPLSFCFPLPLQARRWSSYSDASLGSLLKPRGYRVLSLLARRFPVGSG